MSDVDELKARKLEILKKKLEDQRNLPHLYGRKFYKWARQFFESRNRVNLLVAGNQVSKSSTAIRKMIHWATEKSLWPELWQSEPKQFWYLYPTMDVATIEFREKWAKEWLPRGPMKEDPKYGWREFMSKERKISHIAFNSGVTIYFKSYATDVQYLQSGSVYMMVADEEMDSHLYEELMMRMSAPTIKGYFHSVFTATQSQVFWWRSIERIGHPDEELKEALKLQVSWWDCLEYEDGSPGPFTPEYIRSEEAKLPGRERQRRIYGKFVMSNEDMKYGAFQRELHMVEPHKIPTTWMTVCGIDIGAGGSGGKKGGHPPAICFIAIKPDFTKARVIKIWVPDSHEEFTSPDILKQYRKMKKEINRPLLATYYDHQAKDFFITASRAGEAMIPAEKGKDIGEDILNSLFRAGMLKIYTSDTEKGPEILASQLETLKRDIGKQHAWDDAIDSLRFACTKIPWNFIALETETKKYEESEDIDDRSKNTRNFRESIEEIEKDQNAEFDEWQDLLDGSF